jgi:hypothetical protein
VPESRMFESDASQGLHALAKLQRGQSKTMEWLEDITPLSNNHYYEQVCTYVILVDLGYYWWPRFLDFQLDLEEIPF